MLAIASTTAGLATAVNPRVIGSPVVDRTLGATTDDDPQRSLPNAAATATPSAVLPVASTDGNGGLTGATTGDSGFFAQWLAQQGSDAGVSIANRVASSAYQAAGGQSAWATPDSGSDGVDLLPPSTGAFSPMSGPLNILV